MLDFDKYDITLKQNQALRYICKHIQKEKKIILRLIHNLMKYNANLLNCKHNNKNIYSLYTVLFLIRNFHHMLTAYHDRPNSYFEIHM